MRKFALNVSIAAASLMVAACGKTGDAPKEPDAAANATDTMAPVAEANATDGNTADVNMTATADAANAVEDDDKGGDPGAKK
jgi:hypothetical protein